MCFFKPDPSWMGIHVEEHMDFSICSQLVNFDSIELPCGSGREILRKLIQRKLKNYDKFNPEFLLDDFIHIYEAWHHSSSAFFYPVPYPIVSVVRSDPEYCQGVAYINSPEVHGVQPPIH
jgi:hypothetical protein